MYFTMLIKKKALSLSFSRLSWEDSKQQRKNGLTAVVVREGEREMCINNNDEKPPDRFKIGDALRSKVYFFVGWYRLISQWYTPGRTILCAATCAFKTTSRYVVLKILISFPAYFPTLACFSISWQCGNHTRFQRFLRACCRFQKD